MYLLPSLLPNFGLLDAGGERRRRIQVRHSQLQQLENCSSMSKHLKCCHPVRSEGPYPVQKGWRSGVPHRLKPVRNHNSKGRERLPFYAGGAPALRSMPDKFILGTRRSRSSNRREAG